MRARSSMAMIALVGCVSTNAENGLGTISGTVQLTGAAPSIPQVYVEQDTDVCGSQSRAAQSLLLGTNQVVRDAIVYLGAATADGRHTTNDNSSAVLDQHNCEFVPRVQIAHSGAVLILRNSDPVLHVVRIDSLSGTNGPVPLLNAATPYAGYEKKFRLANFKEPTLLRATSGNGHGWMVAYLAVMPHSWGTITDGNGRFTLAAIPSGAYKLYAWHEVLGTLVRDVKVSGGRVTSIDLEFGTNHMAAATSTARKQSD